MIKLTPVLLVPLAMALLLFLLGWATAPQSQTPARGSVYTNPELLKIAPLYEQLRPLVELVRHFPPIFRRAPPGAARG
jgi:hypothetical protein